MELNCYAVFTGAPPYYSMLFAKRWSTAYECKLIPPHMTGRQEQLMEMGTTKKDERMIWLELDHYFAAVHLFLGKWWMISISCRIIPTLCASKRALRSEMGLDCNETLAKMVRFSNKTWDIDWPRTRWFDLMKIQLKLSTLRLPVFFSKPWKSQSPVSP